jgi:hypothetical protein
MRTEEIERELREMRPEPDPDFARRLDEWAAADFPADAGLGPSVGARGRAEGPFRRAWERLRSTPPRRILMPVGATATAVIVAAVAITQTGGTDDISPGSGQTTTAGVEQGFSNPASPQASAAGADEQRDLSLPDAADEAAAPAPATGSGGGGVAAGTDNRLVDATARLSLAAKADEVPDVAHQVVDVTDAHDGIVLDSQVTTDQGGARANFSLDIPYKQLDSALSELSGLADVVSRTEAGKDITAQANRASRELAGTLERLRKARIELIQADDAQQKLIIQSQIDSLVASAKAYKGELEGVQRKARFATVEVEIASRDSDSGSGGGWSLDDAFHDSGRVLEVIAGIGLVTLAVMLPISLLVLLGWLIAGRTVKRRREAALG